MIRIVPSEKEPSRNFCHSAKLLHPGEDKTPRRTFILEYIADKEKGEHWHSYPFPIQCRTCIFQRHKTHHTSHCNMHSHIWSGHHPVSGCSQTISDRQTAHPMLRIGARSARSLRPPPGMKEEPSTMHKASRELINRKRTLISTPELTPEVSIGCDVSMETHAAPFSLRQTPVPYTWNDSIIGLLSSFVSSSHMYDLMTCPTRRATYHFTWSNKLL